MSNCDVPDKAKRSNTSFQSTAPHAFYTTVRNTCILADSVQYGCDAESEAAGAGHYTYFKSNAMSDLISDEAWCADGIQGNRKISRLMLSDSDTHRGEKQAAPQTGASTNIQDRVLPSLPF